MKSMIVREYGDTDVMELQERPVPEPGEGEVRIQVKAAGINYADIMQRLGLYPGGPRPPFGAGFEVAGVVDAVGAGVYEWEPGAEVMAFCTSGYSEYVISKTWQVMRMPVRLSFVEAAAIPCQYFTGYHALMSLARIRPDTTVLIHAAAGGLGSLMVQIAKNEGAQVIGTASTEEKCALVRELGADFAINYKEQDFVKAVKEFTDGGLCNVVVESVGGDVFKKSFKCLCSRGMLITLGLASKEVQSINPVELLAHNWIVAGFHLMDYMQDSFATANAMTDLHAWIEDGKLRIIAQHTFPLEQAAEAQRFIADRRSVGKVVLTVGE